MILYFSGTGNTRHCAELLATKLDETTHALTTSELRQPNQSRITIAGGERLIFMFPTYSWGIPPFVEAFLRHADFDADPGTEVWMVTTCGDDIGKTATMWRRIMEGRDFNVCSAFSIQMPNTYVCMKGFDVDSPEVEEAKIKALPARIDRIASRIATHDTASGDDVVTGRYAWIKSHIIRPWFKRNAMSTRPFYASDHCDNCGLCRRACPMENIIPGNGARPAWGHHCTMCLRCYHICPKHAIHYGKASDGKGQYRRYISVGR